MREDGERKVAALAPPGGTAGSGAGCGEPIALGLAPSKVTGLAKRRSQKDVGPEADGRTHATGCQVHETTGVYSGWPNTRDYRRAIGTAEYMRLPSAAPLRHLVSCQG